MKTSSGSAVPFNFNCPLYSRDIFDGLPDEVIQALPKLTKRKTYGKGETIFEEGETPLGVLRIETGKALLTHTGIGLETRRSRLLEPDEICGLTEILADVPLETLLEASEQTVIEFIPTEDFIRLVRTENSLCFRLLRLLSSRYQTKWAFSKARFERPDEL